MAVRQGVTLLRMIFVDYLKASSLLSLAEGSKEGEERKREWKGEVLFRGGE